MKQWLIKDGWFRIAYEFVLKYGYNIQQRNTKEYFYLNLYRVGDFDNET